MAFVLPCAITVLEGCDKRDFRPVELSDANGISAYLLDVYETKTDFYKDDKEKTLIQTVEYPQIEDVEFAKANFSFEDVNTDGYADFKLPRSVGENESQYSFFLFHPDGQGYVYHKQLSELVNPQINPSFHVVVTETDAGKSGIVQKQYRFDGFELALESSLVTNADEVIKALVEEVLGKDAVKSIKLLNATDVRVQLEKGTDVIDGDECTIFSALKSKGKRAYFAVNQNGKWYKDESNKGKFVVVKGYEGLASEPNPDGEEGAAPSD
ncbi:MAG: hypothetical protein LBC69_02195 [Eubacteriaceae bacterium]|nr:hypothetical protein [Eubacteriaceae bacterium]